MTDDQLSYTSALHYGPHTRTVRDAALMQNILSGVHTEDIGTLREKVHFPKDLEGVEGWKIAYPVDLGYYQVDSAVCQNMLQVLDLFRSFGCEVKEVDLGGKA